MLDSSHEKLPRQPRLVDLGKSWIIPGCPKTLLADDCFMSPWDPLDPSGNFEIAMEIMEKWMIRLQSCVCSI